MYNQTLYSGLINVVPFWSSNLIKILGLGNEYNIVFNMILTELLKITTGTLNDKILLFITSIIVIVLIGYKFGFCLNINLWTKNVIILRGKEFYNGNGFTIEYCNKILALNNYLLHVKNIKNITYVDDINIIMNDIQNYNLTPKIFLNIDRKKSDNNVYYISYKLISYTEDINKFITHIVDEYKKDSDSQILLIGDEINKIISYPEPIHAINYYVNKNFDFPKLKCMKLTNNQLVKETPIQTTDNNDMEQTKRTPDALNDYSYTLDNIINFNLGKVYLTINRENQQVHYFIKSTEVNCKEWLEDIINIYNQNKNSKFKNKLVLTGQEVIWFKESSYKQYYYSKQMWTLNWILIEKLGYQNYECVNGDENIVQYKYILEPLELFKIQEDLFLTVEKEKNKKWYSSSENKYNNDMNIVYTLYSNSLNIKNILEDYVKEFEKYKNQISVNKILYHFTYSGMKDNKLIFNSKILSEENTDNELFETFDKIYNEHVETLTKDIDKLKDIQYYKNHGLKRKKGYLFHGMPGCGKTSTVVAMALYDSRHIVEIPFSLLTTHEEFEKIMNLKSINNIEINNNNIILVFDEIDIGMEKIGSRTKSSNDDDEKKDNSTEMACAVVRAMKTVGSSDKHKDTTGQNLNLGTLLSKLDGIGNYNGLIIVGTTNHIDNLDPALYRELRLTPIEFKQLRKCDCVKIIQSYFGDYNSELNDILKDRYFTPTKLISLCQIYDYETIEYFFNNVLKNIIGE